MVIMTRCATCILYKGILMLPENMKSMTPIGRPRVLAVSMSGTLLEIR